MLGTLKNLNNLNLLKDFFFFFLTWRMLWLAATFITPGGNFFNVFFLLN